MSNKLFLILSLPFLMLSACKNGLGTQSKTPLGYMYDVHKSTGGVKAKNGDHAYFNVITRAGDSILEDTHIYPFTPNVRIESKTSPDLAAIMDVIKLMSIGDSVTLHIPIDSIPFAERAFQSYKEINHTINLLDLKSDAAAKVDLDKRNKFLSALFDSLTGLDSITKLRLKGIVKDYNDKKLDAQLKITDKGVRYLIVKEGTGIIPKTGDMIEVNYTGSLTNNLIFDSSFPRGQPYVYRLNTGQVIKGWDDSLGNFKEGTEAYLFIPSAMGYGATGSSPNIPPNSELVFYVNLFKVRPMK